MQDTLVNQVMLAHDITYKRLCVYKDALKFLLSGADKQIPVADVELSCAEKHHETLAFLLENFTD